MQTVKRLSFWLMIASVVYAILPILSVLVASALATIGGCDVNEGSAQACMLLGMDIGGLLYTLFVSGWFAFITVPQGFVGLVIGLLGYIISKVALARRAKGNTPAQH